MSFLIFIKIIFHLLKKLSKEKSVLIFLQEKRKIYQYFLRRFINCLSIFSGTLDGRRFYVFGLNFNASQGNVLGLFQNTTL